MKSLLFVPAIMAGLYTAPISTFAATLSEDFSSAPGERGWKLVGDPALFAWDASRQALAVTWDSSRPNSYYALSLGQSIGKGDDFSFSFDIELAHFIAGVSPEAPNPFQLSVALINLSRASGTNFLRGTGADSPDLVEFSFFPDPGGAWQWGPSLTASLIDSTGTNWSTGGFAPVALESNTVYRVSVQYTAADQSLQAIIHRGSEDFAVLSVAKPGAGFTDFAADHFAICSYSGTGQFPAYAGSIWARGIIDNVTITTPQRFSILGCSFQSSRAELQVQSRPSWKYSLERTTDLTRWESASVPMSGTGGELVLLDTNAPPQRAFYRVRAQEIR